MTTAKPSRPLHSVVFLAAKDLANEKLITSCLVFSVVAVLTPILLLISVKVGFIDRLKSEFIEDPTFREIQPAAAKLRGQNFFEDIGAWDDVIFVMPSVMLSPREVDYVVKTDDKRFRARARLWPSSVNDPLFDKLEGTAPAEDAVVITSDIAEKSGLTIGSPFQISVSRVENDKRVRVAIEATVAGIIPEERAPQPTIFAVRAMDRQVESYRAGIGVPDRGWAGIRRVPRQAYQRIMVVGKEPLGERAASNLRIRVGSSKAGAVDRDTAIGLLLNSDLNLQASYKPDEAAHFYVVEKEGRLYSGDDVDEARDALSNEEVDIIGINAPLGASVLGASAPLLGVHPLLLSGPWDAAGPWAIRNKVSYALNDGVYLPEAMRSAWEGQGSAKVLSLEIEVPEGWETGTLSVKVRVLGFVDGPGIMASSALLGMVYRGRGIPINFDATSGHIVEESSGFRGFRVVVNDIAAVPPVAKKFEETGTQVRAKTDEILKLQRLERSLDILVLVIGVVALAGGYAILSSSFFANVQRKRVDYATIRLIGMRKALIFQIPIAQAVIVALLSFAISCVAFAVVSGFLNQVIAEQLNFDGQLSKLYVYHFIFVGAFVVVGSCAASLAASREATRIDPAQALRAA